MGELSDASSPHYLRRKTPTREEEDEMHHTAHDQCFVANSVKTDVKVASGD